MKTEKTHVGYRPTEVQNWQSLAQKCADSILEMMPPEDAKKYEDLIRAHCDILALEAHINATLQSNLSFAQFLNQLFGEAAKGDNNDAHNSGE